MAELTLNRHLDADIATVFDFISKPQHLVEWWGPEGMSLPDHSLNFTKLGPWHSVMQNAEGQTFKVSGQVTHVDAPHSIGFTWAWHDEDDKRGAESFVTLSLKNDPDGGTKFTLLHQELATEALALNHNEGWISSLRKLDRLATKTR